ncbi:hypothetical protein A2318_00545 [Candidatus Uhrbacteria bacterium RIFOXYB2_FULL_45_11]|uniref:Glycosyl transferase family 28 C-terminal domain-containing protein n=1 Tax=Candidatus Uhrbacteria bacterium RIFOXYB2_FULL_45_11 TaxID=1802421 RepID=A0A1F7W6A6_9BACT|nr:MAG: hypothetical protein A2318_00545 [Candidatus Uhrbacteria bacterium RIFOXYB2_FULL_45_11]
MTSKRKLLLNAEPFGFGPTAAIATFFPYLREKFDHIGFAGEKHSLDLQKDLAYDALFDLTNASEEDLKTIFAEYDVVCTALDFTFAAKAKAAGLDVIIYDPLTWYWKSVPEIVSQSDVYLAQDFFGVKERIAQDRETFSKTVHVVAPIIEEIPRHTSRQYVLVNLGGLQNPFWNVEDVETYARTWIEAIKSAIPGNEQLVIATSRAVAEKLNDPQVRNFNRSEMQSVMEQTKYAFMTPGLGNIYDAATNDLPTIWLPPVNDSQGQQLRLLQQNKMIDAVIDWADLGFPIDYKKDQKTVLKQIRDAIFVLKDDESLVLYVDAARKLVESRQTSATHKILETFGTGGARKIAEAIFEFCST